MILSGARPGFGPEQDPTRRFPTVSKRRVHVLTPGWFAMVLAAIAVVIGFENPNDRPAGAGVVLLSSEQRDRPIRKIAFTPDDLLVAVQEGNSRLTFWEARGGGPWMAMDGDGLSIQCFAVDPGGDHVAMGGLDGSIRLMNLRTGQDGGSLALDETPVRALAFSPDGVRMASGHADGRLTIWEVGTGSPLLDLDASQTPLVALAFSPDGRSIASTHADGKVAVRDAETGSVRASVVTEQALLRSLVFSADGGTLWWTTMPRRGIRRWDFGSGGGVQPLRDTAEEIIPLPDGRSLLVRVDRERVWQLDAETLRIERRYRFPGRILSSIGISRDGTRIALGGLETVEIATLAHFVDPSPGG
jgi:sugar lactone lactonase YvrE